MMDITVPIYQSRSGANLHAVTLGLGAHTKERAGRHAQKLEEQLVDDLRRAVESASPRELGGFILKRGTRLERVRVELVLRGEGKKRKVSGLCPVILEPRAGEGWRFVIAYHPRRQGEWFPVRAERPLAEQAATFFQKAWEELDDDALTELWSSGKDLLKIVSLTARPKSLLDELPDRKKGIWDDLDADPAKQKGKKTGGGYRVLSQLGTDLTARAESSKDHSAPRAPRSPYREQLLTLLSGKRPRPTLVVGPSGVGKTTILSTWVRDLMDSEDYPSHRNLDRLTHVWTISGKQIIAGMSYVGDWEKRCVELLEDAKKRPVILLVPDLYAFGKIGRARDSERSLADFFRGPVARGEIAFVGECTPDQLRRLEEDAGPFASLFTRVHVRPATREETLHMMVAAARKLEAEHNVEFDPWLFPEILELGEALFPAQALPGKALDMLAHLAVENACEDAEPVEIEHDQLQEHLIARTRMTYAVLFRTSCASSAVEAWFAERVMGQPEAVRVAADAIQRMGAALVDPRRPYGVYLFTGPTGTGKTELAKALALYLFDSTDRLLRLDMSEFASPDAVARLIGDAWNPDGLLTRAIQEQPFSVVLFDEIEKAHPAVLNLLLQLFDEGRLTDAAGNTASFTQSIVVMTSNLGARTRPPAGFGASPDQVMLDVAKAVRDFFPPELFNRIDRIVPFRPLSREVAVDVAQKELTKLLSRRGLIDRNIFVHANRAVVERVAAEAFRQEDGARSLKRFLEDRIGARLSEEIAKAPNAAMQVVRLFAASGDPDDDDASGGFVIEHEPLVEAEPCGARFALEPLLDLPLADLRARLPALARELDAIEASSRFAGIEQRIDALLAARRDGHADHDTLWNLDWTRASLRGFREKVDRLLVDSRDLGYEQLEQDKFGHQEVEVGGELVRMRVLSRLRATDGARAATRRELLECFAQSHFLRRSLARVDDPAQHAIVMEVVPVGSATNLVGWLTGAYAGWGTLAGWAAAVSGAVKRGADRRTLASVVSGRQVDAVFLHLVGICIKDFAELETGTHIWQALAAPPELVRVRVLAIPPGASDAQGALLPDMVTAFLAKRAELDHARSDGRGAIDSPTRLLPIVRRVSFTVPKTGLAPLELEDYAMGHGGTFYAKSVADALATLWLLRMTRDDGAPPSSRAPRSVAPPSSRSVASSRRRPS